MNDKTCWGWPFTKTDERHCWEKSSAYSGLAPMPLPSPLSQTLRKHPAYFGVPFILIIVGASFGLQTFTQTRYDLHDQKVSQVCLLPSVVKSHVLMALQVTKEAALGLDKNRRKLDIREEYFVSCSFMIRFSSDNTIHPSG